MAEDGGARQVDRPVIALVPVLATS